MWLVKTDINREGVRCVFNVLVVNTSTCKKLYGKSVEGIKSVRTFCYTRHTITLYRTIPSVHSCHASSISLESSVAVGFQIVWLKKKQCGINITVLC